MRRLIRLTERLTRRQRQALTVLGMANLIALSVLGVLLMRAPPSPEGSPQTSPIDPQNLEVCRGAVSRALLDTGNSGLVQTQEDGVILIQLERMITSDNLRPDADAAVWTALEAVPSRGECLGFGAVQVTVVFVSPTQSATCPDGPTCSDRLNMVAPSNTRPVDPVHVAETRQPLRSTARVSIPDLLLWSMGSIDDAELTRRLDYQPPATFMPTLSEPTVTP